MSRPRWHGSLVIFLVAAAATNLLFINFCATVFQCGCQWLWGNADRYCNIHAAHGKRCPWCVFGYGGYALVIGTMLFVQAIVAFRLPGWRWRQRLVAALAAFPLTGSILALAMGFYTEYWD